MTVFENKQAFFDGVRDGLPIGMAYFAVAFSLGIAANNAGLTPFQGFTAAAKVAFLLPVCEKYKSKTVHLKYNF